MNTRKVWGDRLWGQLIPAVPVPRTKDGCIDEDAQENYAAYMADQPVGGVAVWAHTGRGLHLSEVERNKVLRVWRRAMKDRVVVAGVGVCPNESATNPFKAVREMAYEAKAGGADCLLAYPPTFLREGDIESQVVSYHEAVAEAGLPVIAFYLYRAAGGWEYSPSMLRRLFGIPGIVGIKMATLDSIMTFQDVSRLIQNDYPDITLITGEDRMFGYTLLRGAKAALVGLGAACPGPQKALIDALLKGRSGEFLHLSNEVDYFAEATFVFPMEQYVQRMLWALSVLGVIPESSTFDPLQPSISEEDKRSVENAVRRLQLVEAQTHRSEER